MYRFAARLTLVVILGLLLVMLSIKRDKKVAILYYSNESSPQGLEKETYQTIVGWLRESKEPSLVKFAQRMEDDVALFPKTVDAEISTLQTAQKQGALPVPVFAVTNRLAKKQTAWLFSPQSAEPVEYTLAIEAPSSQVFRENPTSSPDFFEAFLKMARDLFPSDDYDYVLITKSHGNSEMAMMPFIRLWPGDITKDEFLNLARESLLTKKDSNHELPHNAHLLGVSKNAYRSTLDRSGMQFRIVLMESCFGGPSLNTDVATIRLPYNVDKLFGAIDHGVPYDNIDYGSLFALRLTPDEFVSRFEQTLHEKFSVERRRISMHTMAWILVLIAFLGMAYSLIRHGPKGNAGMA